VGLKDDVHHSLCLGLRSHRLARHERLDGQLAVGLKRGLDRQFLRADDALQDGGSMSTSRTSHSPPLTIGLSTMPRVK
jgi:hypothetical protein